MISIYRNICLRTICTGSYIQYRSLGKETNFEERLISNDEICCCRCLENGYEGDVGGRRCGSSSRSNEY